MQSKIFELKNNFFNVVQNKFEKLTEKSVILKKLAERIDDIILLFMSITLFVSTFMQSEQIGLFAILMVLLTVLKLFIKKGSKINWKSWDAAIFVYFVICFISTINSTLLPQSIHGFLKTVIYILYYYSAANYFQTNQSKIKYVIYLVSILCGIEAIIAIYQNFAGVEQISTWQDSNYINPEDAIARAYGTLKPYNPNLLGGYLLAGIPFVTACASICLIKKQLKSFWLSITIFALCSFAVFLTGSRGAYLGLGAIVGVGVLLIGLILRADFKQAEKIKSLYKKSVMAILGLFALVLIAIPKITKRLLSIFILRGDSSTSFRMNVYHSSWQMFCDNFILGIGAGNQTFREIYGLYMITGFDALSTYSVPLEIAVESGIFGLISFLTFIILLFISAFKFIIKSSPNDLGNKLIVASMILTITGVMMHGMFDTIYFRPQVQFLFWTMIAIGSSKLCNQLTINNQ